MITMRSNVLIKPDPLFIFQASPLRKVYHAERVKALNPLLFSRMFAGRLFFYYPFFLILLYQHIQCTVSFIPHPSPSHGSNTRKSLMPVRTGDSDALEGMTVLQLRDELKKRGMKPGTLRKAELMERILELEKAEESPKASLQSVGSALTPSDLSFPTRTMGQAAWATSDRVDDKVRSGGWLL